MPENFSNGATKIQTAIEHLTQKHTSLEMILNDGFKQMHEGLTDVSNEIRLTRAEGFLPLSVVNKLLDSNIITSDKMGDRTFKVMLTILNVMIGVILCLLGLKQFFPQILGA